MTIIDAAAQSKTFNRAWGDLVNGYRRRELWLRIHDDGFRCRHYGRLRWDDSEETGGRLVIRQCPDRRRSTGNDQHRRDQQSRSPTHVRASAVHFSGDMSHSRAARASSASSCG